MSNLGHKMMGPLLFAYKGFAVIFFNIRKKFKTVKKNPKKSFSPKKKFLLKGILKML